MKKLSVYSPKFGMLHGKFQFKNTDAAETIDWEVAEDSQ